jgi:hypothetical protein
MMGSGQGQHIELKKCGVSKANEAMIASMEQHCSIDLSQIRTGRWMQAPQETTPCRRDSWVIGARCCDARSPCVAPNSAAPIRLQLSHNGYGQPN